MGENGLLLKINACLSFPQTDRRWHQLVHVNAKPLFWDLLYPLNSFVELGESNKLVRANRPWTRGRYFLKLVMSCSFNIEFQMELLLT